MIKAEIVKVLAQKMNIKEPEALIIVDQVIASIRDVLIEHGRLEIRDFGVFKVKEKQGRIGRNPKNGIEYLIPPRKVVVFKAGKTLKSNHPTMEINKHRIWFIIAIIIHN